MLLAAALLLPPGVDLEEVFLGLLILAEKVGQLSILLRDLLSLIAVEDHDDYCLLVRVIKKSSEIALDEGLERQLLNDSLEVLVVDVLLWVQDAAEEF